MTQKRPALTEARHCLASKISSPPVNTGFSARCSTKRAQVPSPFFRPKKKKLSRVLEIRSSGLSFVFSRVLSGDDDDGDEEFKSWMGEHFGAIAGLIRATASI